MKRLLCIIMSLSVLLSTLSVSFSYLTSAEESGDNATLIFESLPLEDDYELNEKNGVNDVNLWLTTGNLGAVPSDTEVKYDQGNLIKFHNYFASNKILEDNDYAGDTSEITDFVWEFDYRPGNAQYANVSFLFHVNENSHIPTGSEQPRSTIQNVMGVSFFGYNAAKTDAENELNILRIDAPSASGAYESADNYTSDSGKTTLSYVRLSRNSGTYIYTIRIVLKGNQLTASVWEKANKADTYRSVHYEYTDDEMALAPNGDFAIVQGNTSGFVKDMKIYKVSDEPQEPVVNTEVAVNNPPIRFERASTEGYVEARDGKFIVLGKNASNYGDTIAVTKGLTGRALTDFTVKYVCSTTEVGWGRNILVLRATNPENPNSGRAYAVSLQGSNETPSGQTKSTSVVIVKDDTRLQSSNANGVRTNLNITKNTDYNVEVKVQGNKIYAWVYKVGTVKPSSPTVTYTDTENKYPSGDIAFASRAGAMSVSDITLIDDKTGEVICSDYSPQIYNSDEFTNSTVKDGYISSGMVKATADGYRIIAKSDFDGGVRPVQTNELPMGYSFENFELGFDYKSNSDDGASKLLFNSGGASAGGYSLSLPGKASGSDISLNENGNVLVTADMTLETGTVYRCEVSKVAQDIKVWIYPKDGTKPANPTLAYSEHILLGEGNVYFYTANGDFTVNNISLKVVEVQSVDKEIPSDHILYNNSKLTFEKASKEGIVNLRDGRVVFSAQTEDGKSSWLTSKGVTGNEMTHYTLKYTYVPSSTKWPVDVVNLRTPESESDYRSKGYFFGIQGYGINIDGAAQTKSAIWITKDSSAGQTTSELDASKGVMLKDVSITAGTEYNVEITVWNSIISVRFYQAGTARPETPTLTYTDESKSYTSGDFAFIARDAGYAISDITLEDPRDHTVIVDNYSPDIYNKQTLILTNMGLKSYNTGTVTSSGNSVRIRSNNSISATSYPVATNYLNYKDGKYFKNFALDFVYSIANLEENSAIIHFNSRDVGSEYKLVLDKSANGSTVSLYKDETKLVGTNCKIAAGVNLNVTLSNKDGKIEVYIYKEGQSAPDTPALTFTDTAPLPSGNIFFSTEQGDFTLSGINLKVNDAANVAEPIYELNFEDKTMGDGVVKNGSGELITEDNNTYLRLTKDDYRDGRISFTFGPSGVKNFTLNMNMRVTSNSNARWFYANLMYHNYSGTVSGHYEAQIFSKGSDIAAVSEKLGYTNTNHKLALSGPIVEDSGSPNPQHDYAYGLQPDYEWHKVSVVCDGFTSSLYIDGRLVVQATDPEKLFEKGGFRLGGWGVNYDIDNIRIYTETYYDLAYNVIQTGPTGLIFQKDFEGEDKNMDGLNFRMGNKEKTAIVTDENSNSFLRIYGDKDFGVNARSLLTFGSDFIRNFDFSAKIRLKSAFNTNWSYVTVGVHGDYGNYRGNAIWMDVAPRGSAVVLLNSKLGLSDNNMVASTGIVKRNQQTVFIPDNDRSKGIPLDGKWHDIKVSARGYTYTLYIDGVEIISYTDPEQTYERGATYLYSYGANYDVDDILLTNYSEYTGEAEPLDITVLTDDSTIKLSEKEVTGEILASKGTKTKDLESFEWEFDYKAANTNWGRTAFLYHVTDRAKLGNATQLSNLQDVFGICVTGPNINQNTGKENIISGIKNNAITVLAPDQATNYYSQASPIVYTLDGEDINAKKIPDASSYISLEATDKLKAIDVGKWMTINIRLIGNRVTVTVWQTDNKDETLRRKHFVIPYTAIEAIPKGDFAVANGNNGATIRNMTVKNADLAKSKSAGKGK